MWRTLCQKAPQRKALKYVCQQPSVRYIYIYTHTRFFSCVFILPAHQAGRSVTRVSLPRLCASLSQIFKLPCFQLSALTIVNVVALIKCL